MARSRSRTGALLVAALAALTAALSLTAPGATASPEALAKVSPAVLRATENGGSARFLVLMRSNADVGWAARLTGQLAKGRYVYRSLRAFADRTQEPVRTVLDRMHASYRTFYVVNALVVTASRSTVETLAARSDVERIDADPWIRSTLLPASAPRIEPRSSRRNPTAGIEWNIAKVHAPQVWHQRDIGQGIVVGDIDTGQQWDHPALKNKYRGWDGTTANHAYNWYDEINPADLSPIDQNGHGTHTAGTIVGNAGNNHIGVAPGAKWMACRSMDISGFGSQDTYLGCMQFMLAPWDLTGHNPDPSKAPNVISNSWFCSITQEGCTQATLAQVVHNLRMAGIVVVVAAGNDGPTCSTIGIQGPPAQYDDSFTVGATTNSTTNDLASFSSRGPATFNGQTLVKPDITAPGDGVRSSYPPNGYAVLSGTSMATPHITGVVALVLSAKPSLIGNVDAIESLLDTTAVHRNSSACSSNGSYPNNLYGYGFVDAAAAVVAAMSFTGPSRAHVGGVSRV